MSNRISPLSVPGYIALVLLAARFGVVVADCVAADGVAPTYNPPVAEASDQAQRALKRIRAPKGFQVEVFAAEPLLANPVAFCVDSQGRFYVAETFRHHAGVTDNRQHMYWLEDDLAARTVEDRVAMYRKHLGERFAEYIGEHERVRLIEDRDGDGVADHSQVFADGFSEAADGIGAGLLARNGKVWFACIPALWLLQDTTGDGHADQRRALHTGYGVHVAFLGHDLHGLRMGPDGKLYFSIGDRGLNVTTPERHLYYPDTGAVLRCNPDGSDLEVFAFGLRNPQELAFDEYGNLFTGDNNSDGGDKARWVHVVEGGDSGWRIGYQYLNTPVRRGPWNDERLWTPEGARQAAYLVPPIANLADGPSGLTYYPGTGLTPEYQGNFFLADFRGGSAQSGIRTFKQKRQGASFELDKPSEFVWSVLATDVDFGIDSALYISDWVEGWDKTGRGRIYKVTAQGQVDDPQVAEVRQLIIAGMRHRPAPELASLLRHGDMRIRQEAQFALADAGAEHAELLAEMARHSDHQLARIHAIWALGQIGRDDSAVVEPLITLLNDRDDEIRAQAAKVLGDVRCAPAYDQLVERLADGEPRVRFFAAQSLGKLGRTEAIPGLFAMIDANGDDDPYLRHAGVTALARINDAQAVLARAEDPSPAVRMAVLLTLRRWESAEIARYLDDENDALVLEAARAINDVPIDAATAKLAQLANRPDMPVALARRVLNACVHSGAAADAASLATYAADKQRSEATRVEALDMLTHWATPGNLDRVMGLWRPVEPRDAGDAVAALSPLIAHILADSPDKVTAAAAQAAGALDLDVAADALSQLVANTQRGSTPRAEAIKALAAIDAPQLELAVKGAVSDSDAMVRAEARRWLVKLHPSDAVPVVTEVLAEGSLREQQAAIASLGEMDSREVDDLLLSLLERLASGELPSELHLDVLLAAQARSSNQRIAEKLAAYDESRPSSDPLSAWRECLTGGDARQGRAIFFEKTEAACLRCHRVGIRGGEVGPVLNSIGLRESREHLLEAIVAPNVKIAQGFDSVIVALDDGEVLSGVFKSEDEDTLSIMSPEGKLLTIEKARIEERGRGQSAMPEDAVKVLTKSEIRDLVEFLTSLR